LCRCILRIGPHSYRKFEFKLYSSVKKYSNEQFFWYNYFLYELFTLKFRLNYHIMCVSDHCPVVISIHEACLVLQNVAWHVARCLCTRTGLCCPLLGRTDQLRHVRSIPLILSPLCFTVPLNVPYIHPFAARASHVPYSIRTKQVVLRFITAEHARTIARLSNWDVP
jgi:hypothetical protein